MKVCLDNLVGKRFWAPKGGRFQVGHKSAKANALDGKSHLREANNCDIFQRSWKEVVGSRTEDHQTGFNRRNWRVAVLVFRFSISMSWRSIKDGLTKLLNVYHDLTPLAADRAVLWCDNELDMIKMEKLGRCFLPEIGVVKLQRWNPHLQMNNSKIVCSNSWLGIEGLPLNMWNKNVFKVIGRKCGGLLDIANCTEELTCLTQAVVKLKGNSGGFIQERMVLFCWGKRVVIKFVPSWLGDTGFHGDRQGQGRNSKEEDDGDVAICRGNTDLIGEASGLLLSDFSDKKRSDKSEGQLAEEQSGLPTQKIFALFRNRNRVIDYLFLKSRDQGHGLLLTTLGLRRQSLLSPY